MFADNNTNEFLVGMLEQNIRMDGRECFQMREIDIYFMDKYGHLLFQQGGTQIMVKIVAEISAPRPERPAEGLVSFKVNCSASPHGFEQNKKNSNELTKLLEKVVLGSNALDPESLCILTGKFVWQLVIDCVVIRDEGNLFDPVLNAVMAGLMDMRKPLVNIEKSNVILGEKQLALSIAHTPFSFTFGMVGNTVFIDPALNEEANAETRITVSMNVYKELCSVHKPGGKGINENVLSGVMRVCENRIKEVTGQMREAVKSRKSIRNAF